MMGSMMTLVIMGMMVAMIELTMIKRIAWTR